LRIPAHRGHSFWFIVGSDSGIIVGSDSGSSWAPISAIRRHAILSIEGQRYTAIGCRIAAEVIGETSSGLLVV
jgi:photosystem II stability/assembly factor-like uncharacterized protein